jgi:glucose-1-phosphate thymidylyltransferase
MQMSASQARRAVAVITAAGSATRLGPLPCSKELFPIGLSHGGGSAHAKPKVACQYLLEKLRLSGIRRAYIIIRAGKWDIPLYFGDGKSFDIDLAYLMMDLPYGPPYTLNQAYPFVKDDLVAFGFPDILFKPDDVFTKLLIEQQQSKADVVLGLFPADQPAKMDMVKIDDSGRVVGIVAKPAETDLLYSWAAAVWSPVFTEFLRDFVHSHMREALSLPELSVGDVIHSAATNHLKVRALEVSNEPYLDIGTPEGLIAGMRRSVLEQSAL